MTPEEYIKNVLKTESVNIIKIRERLSSEYKIRLLHGAIGMVTEAGEIMDMIKKHIFYGADLDLTNLKEELGDSDWYRSIICDAAKFTIEEIWETNIAKLKSRYGEKFGETRALNRDLDKERKILES